MTNSGNVSIEVWGIVLGANDQLMNIELPYGYELVHRKLNESCLKDEITLRNNKIDVKYCASNLGSDEEPEFIFIHKKKNMDISAEYFTIGKMLSGNEETFNMFDEMKRLWNREIFILLSMLRLAQEGNIEIADKKFVCVAKNACNKVSENSMSMLDNPISVYDDLYNLQEESIEVFNMIKKLPEIFLEEMQDLFSKFESGYSASRIEDAYKNLVSLAEILLIGYKSDDKGKGKKEKFANRIVAAIAEDSQAKDMQQELKLIYKERSDETHEGKSENINLVQLKKLRKYIRKVVLDFICFCNSRYEEIGDKTFDGMKKIYVPHLISRVEYLQNNNLIES